MATADEDGIVLLWSVKRASTFPEIELIGRLDMIGEPVAESDNNFLPPGVFGSNQPKHRGVRKRFTTVGNNNTEEQDIASLLYSSRKDSLAHMLEESHHSSIGVSSLQAVIPPNRSDRSSIVNNEAFVFLVASLDSGKIVSWNVKQIFEDYNVMEIRDATSYKNVCTLRHSYKPYLKSGLKPLCSKNSNSEFKSTVSSTLIARMKARRNHSVLTYPQQKRVEIATDASSAKQSSPRKSRLPTLSKAPRLSKAPIHYVQKSSTSTSSFTPFISEKEKRKTRLMKRKTEMYVLRFMDVSLFSRYTDFVLVSFSM